MSSTDSSLLSAASLLTVNVVQEFLMVCNVKVSNTVGGWILRLNTVILGAIATVIAITYSSGLA
jgi:Na+/proline symporter